jgi:ubiquinone/menaquinone biosynthesis C-methylase UbiE
MRKNGGRFARRAAVTLLLLAAWRVYSRRTRERVPGREGIEDAASSQAFALMTRTPPFRWLREFVVRGAVALQSRGEALDLGCGPGYLAVRLAQQSPELHVAGIDLSEEMLNLAQEHARRAGVEQRTTFRRGDARQIPFPNGSLDLVVSTLSLHHWSDPVAALDEIARVLKPGGGFYIFDLRRDMSAPFYLLVWTATQFVVPAALHRINEPMGSRNAAYTPEEVKALAERSRLSGWQVSAGPMWVALEGRLL